MIEVGTLEAVFRVGSASKFEMQKWRVIAPEGCEGLWTNSFAKRVI